MPLQIAAGVGVHSMIVLGFFGAHEVLDTYGANDGAVVISLLTDVLVAHYAGELILPGSRYVGLTLLAGLLGAAPWKIIGPNGGNWRVLNYGLPPAIAATVCFALQALLLPEASIRVNGKVLDDGMSIGFSIPY
jgi:hypothetical protein